MLHFFLAKEKKNMDGDFDWDLLERRAAELIREEAEEIVRKLIEEESEDEHDRAVSSSSRKSSGVRKRKIERVVVHKPANGKLSEDIKKFYRNVNNLARNNVALSGWTLYENYDFLRQFCNAITPIGGTGVRFDEKDRDWVGLGLIRDRIIENLLEEPSKKLILEEYFKDSVIPTKFMKMDVVEKLEKEFGEKQALFIGADFNQLKTSEFIGKDIPVIKLRARFLLKAWLDAAKKISIPLVVNLWLWPIHPLMSDGEQDLIGIKELQNKTRDYHGLDSIDHNNDDIFAVAGKLRNLFSTERTKPVSEFLQLGLDNLYVNEDLSKDLTQDVQNQIAGPKRIMDLNKLEGGWDAVFNNILKAWFPDLFNKMEGVIYSNKVGVLFTPEEWVKVAENFNPFIFVAYLIVNRNAFKDKPCVLKCDLVKYLSDNIKDDVCVQIHAFFIENYDENVWEVDYLRRLKQPKLVMERLQKAFSEENTTDTYVALKNNEKRKYARVAAILLTVEMMSRYVEYHFGPIKKEREAQEKLVQTFEMNLKIKKKKTDGLSNYLKTTFDNVKTELGAPTTEPPTTEPLGPLA